MAARSRGGVIDVATLTDRSPAYWRTMITMEPGVPLAPAVSVALLVVNGKRWPTSSRRRSKPGPGRASP